MTQSPAPVDLSQALVMSHAEFKQLFPVVAAHMSARPQLAVDERSFIFTQMPSRGASYVGRVRVKNCEGGVLEQDFTVRRITEKTGEPASEDILFGISFAYLGAQQGIGIDKVLFSGGAGLDLAQPVDKDHQTLGMMIAMRYARFLGQAHTALGKKPEAFPFQTDERNTLMELLAGDPQKLKAHIEQLSIADLIPGSDNPKLKVAPETLVGITRTPAGDDWLLAIEKADPERPLPGGNAQVLDLHAFAKRRAGASRLGQGSN